MNFVTVKIDREIFEKEKFHPQLLESIDDALKNKERVFVLAGRKGTASGIMCWDCGFVLKCNSCESPLSFYEKIQDSRFRIQDSNQLVCRHCATTYSPPTTCPNCLGVNFKYFGYGILELYKTLKERFPTQPLFIISSDEIKNVKQLSEKLNRFEKVGGILLGTELALKESLPKTMLSIVFLLEQLLVFPDYKIRERVRKIIHFLCQKSKSVIVQTFNPDNEFLELIKNPEKFYEHELLNREHFFLPPYSILTKIKIKDKNNLRALTKISYLRRDIEQRIAQKDLHIEVLGPVHAFIPRIKNFWIFELILKVDPRIPLEERTAIFSLASPEFIIDVEPKSLI